MANVTQIWTQKNLSTGAIYPDTRGGKFQIAFVNGEDTAIFTPKIFGLSVQNWGDPKNLVNELLAIETFLNWYQFSYKVSDREITLEQAQKSLSREQLDWVSTHGVFSRVEYYFFHHRILKGRRAKKKIKIKRKDGTIKESNTYTDTFAGEDGKIFLKEMTDHGFKNLIIPGYEDKADDIVCRIMVQKGNHVIPTSIIDGGNLYDTLSPFDDAYLIQNDSESEAIGDVVSCSSKKIAKQWAREKQGWIHVAQWVQNLALMLDMPRHEIVRMLGKRVQEKNPVTFVESVRSLHKELDTEHALSCFLALKEYYQSIKNKEEIDIKVWSEGYRIVKPAHENFEQEVATAILWKSFQNTFDALIKKAIVCASKNEPIDPRASAKTSVRIKYFGLKTEYLLAYENAWKDFAANIRKML